MKSHFFSNKLIAWYEQNKRDLPWRNTRDPYKIWLSEVILQQTRVNQGLPYYHTFTENYPTISDLALADEQRVLRDWQGLGYYSRARNLHKCAIMVHESYNKEFPKIYSEIIKLPGIGKYTAAAISSFAFKQRVAAIDGNVYRVLSRIFGIDDDITTGKGQRSFEKLSEELIPERQPDLYNQAMMEFGALHCTPKKPKCESCIFNVECWARKSNGQDTLPVKSKKIKVRHRYFYYFNIVAEDKLLMRERKSKDIWQGLFDFHLVERESTVEMDDIWSQDNLLKSLVKLPKKVEINNTYKHVLSHQQIHATFCTIKLDADSAQLDTLIPDGYDLYNNEEVLKLPKPVLISKYLNDGFY
ncbi:MAG: A/G-specific adenine glycosylase [Bacteroidota bacterium]